MYVVYEYVGSALYSLHLKLYTFMQGLKIDASAKIIRQTSPTMRNRP